MDNWYRVYDASNLVRPENVLPGDLGPDEIESQGDAIELAGRTLGLRHRILADAIRTGFAVLPQFRLAFLEEIASLRAMLDAYDSDVSPPEWGEYIEVSPALMQRRGIV